MNITIVICIIELLYVVFEYKIDFVYFISEHFMTLLSSISNEDI